MNQGLSTARYLPKNKFIYVLLVVLLVAGGVFFFKKRGEAERKEVASQGVKTATELFSIDSDQDGLEDWEEIVLKTDPENPDTDGDGTPDGEERKAGRSPLVKGPSDILTPEQIAAEARGRGEVSSEMDTIFLKMFAEVSALKQDGKWKPGATSTLDAIAKKEMEAYGKKVVRLDAYSENDIRVTNNSSAEAVRAYGNAAGEVIIKNDVPIGIDPDLLIIYKATVKGGGEKALKDLDLYITYYQKSVADLLLVPVPKPVAKIHLDYINAMSAYGNYLLAMRASREDPFAAVAAFKRYQEVMAAYGSSIDAMRLLFKKYGVVFTGKEPGRVFAPISTSTAKIITDMYKKAGIPFGIPADQLPPKPAYETSIPLTQP